MSWFDIERGAIPIYRQVQSRIGALCLGGSLPPGTKLPSSRALASTLKVSRSSVVMAYEALQSEGILEPLSRTGTYVGMEHVQSRIHDDLARNDPEPSEIPNEHLPTTSPPAVADLSGLAPPFDPLSAERFRWCLNHVLTSDPAAVLGEESYEGYAPFRVWLASYMTKRGVPSSSDNVLTVAGYHEGLALVCKTLLECDHAVALENPTSIANISLFRSIGATVHGVPMTSSGIDVDELDKLATRVKVGLVCVRSVFHDPTGVVMAQDVRQALLKCAEKHGFLVVEDAFTDELCYSGRLIPPLKADDRSERVVYIDSLCRLVFPGTRTGWIVGPRDLVSRLSSVKRVMDLGSSIVMESACYEFCRMEFLLNHIRRMRKVYQRRRQAMLDALERYMPKGVAWHVTEGGLTAWLAFPRRVDSQVIYERAREAGVLVTPGSVFFVDGGGQRNLRLTYGSVDETELGRSVRILGRLARASVRQVSP